MSDPTFLSLEDILFIHQQEIRISGGEPNIRDQDGAKACVDSPKVSFGGENLNPWYQIKMISNILYAC